MIKPLSNPQNNENTQVGTELGYGVDLHQEGTASAVVDAIYRVRVEYDELKHLYLGIFSRKPNNLFEANYTELRGDILTAMSQAGLDEGYIFKTLFLLLKEGRIGIGKCQEVFGNREYSGIFKRFFDKPRYGVYLYLLAACGTLRLDLAQKPESTAEAVGFIGKFLGDLKSALESNPSQFVRCCVASFQVLATVALDSSQTGSEAEVAQNMFNKISNTPFSTLVQKLLLTLDTQAGLEAKT